MMKLSFYCMIFCSLMVGKLLPLPMGKMRQRQRDSIYAFLEMQGACRSAGYANGCCTAGSCFVESETCYCDERCYSEGTCCNDIQNIGCFPTTCGAARLLPGCCQSSANCYVPSGRCYCDWLCLVFNDCCEDVMVPTSCTNQANRFSNVQNEFSRTKDRRMNTYAINQMLRQKQMFKLTNRTKLLSLLG